MIDDNIGLILGLFLKHLLRFCDLRPGNTVLDATNKTTDSVGLFYSLYRSFHLQVQGAPKKPGLQIMMNLTTAQKF